MRKVICGTCAEEYNADVATECPYCEVHQRRDEVQVLRNKVEIERKARYDAENKLRQVEFRIRNMKQSLELMQDS